MRYLLKNFAALYIITTLAGCAQREQKLTGQPTYGEIKMARKKTFVRERIEAKIPDISVADIIKRHIDSIGGTAVIEKIHTFYEESQTIDEEEGDTIFTFFWCELGSRARTIRALRGETKHGYMLAGAGFELGPNFKDTIKGDFNEQVELFNVTNKPFDQYLYGANYYSMPALLPTFVKMKAPIIRTDKPDDWFYQLSLGLPGNRTLVLSIDPISFLVVRNTMIAHDQPFGSYLTEFEDFTTTDDGFRYPRQQISNRLIDTDPIFIDTDYKVKLNRVLYNVPIGVEVFDIPDRDIKEYNKRMSGSHFPIDRYRNKHAGSRKNIMP